MIFFSSARGDIDAYRSLSLSCQGGEVFFSGGHCDNLRSPLNLVSRTLSLAVSLSALRYSLQSAVPAARLLVSVNFSFPAMVYFVAISLWGDAGLYRRWLILREERFLFFPLMHRFRTGILNAHPVFDGE